MKVSQNLQRRTGGESLSNGKEIEATLYRTLAQIAERERLKAIHRDDYGKAFFVGILEGIFRDAAISTKET